MQRERERKRERDRQTDRQRERERERERERVVLARACEVDWRCCCTVERVVVFVCTILL